MYLLSCGLSHFFLIPKLDFSPSLSSIFMCFKASSGGVEVSGCINSWVLSFAFWILAKTSFWHCWKNSSSKELGYSVLCLLPELSVVLYSPTVVLKIPNRKTVPELKSVRVIVLEAWQDILSNVKICHRQVVRWQYQEKQCKGIEWNLDSVKTLSSQATVKAAVPF